jgi:malonyl CoA-acyl carrier protein transacylase
VVTGAVPPGGAGKVVFVFPGQGGQWAGMGRELAACCPVFAARLAECSAVLAPYTDWDLLEVLAGAEGAPGLDRVDVVQPALWAVMVSLAAVWQAAGVVPDAVIGHSQGEIAAATVAGILSLEDAAKVVALRSRALAALAGRGGMLSVAEPAAAVRDRIGRWGDRLAVAAVNGPSAAVVSGEPGALAQLAAACAAAGVRARAVPVDYASHSAQVEALREDILRALAPVTPGQAQIPMISAMTGQWLDGPEAGAGYWYDSLRNPVEFDRAVRALAGGGHQVFIEASPHPVLTAAVTETLEDADAAIPVTVTGTLRRGDGGPARFLTALAAAHVHGTPVDWATVTGRGQTVDLPTYAFQHQRYWPRPPAAAGGDVSAATEARFWAAVEGGDLPGLARTLAVEDERWLAEMLPALAAWRRREQDRSVTGGWRYRITWVPVPDPGPALLSGTWLVLAAAGQLGAGLTRACVQALVACGAEVAGAEIGTGVPDRGALAAWIGRLVQGRAGLAGVVSLLALDDGPAAGFPQVPTGLAATQVLIQALGDAGMQAPLWVVTCGAVAVPPGEGPASPVQAMAWGLGLVAGLEHPDRWGGLADVPPVLDEVTAGRLCGVLTGCGEDQVAIRGTGIWARRLARAPQARSTRGWRPGGTVLVTGGTGGIGGRVARWAVGRGAPAVVLAGRSGPAAPGAARLAVELAGAGARAEVIACDVASRERTAGLLARIAAGGPPLAAVLHAAGIGQQTPLCDTTVAELAQVTAAKAAGAAHLDALTTGTPLEQFVLFSSAAAAWGSGQ